MQTSQNPVSQEFEYARHIYGYGDYTSMRPMRVSRASLQRNKLGAVTLACPKNGLTLLASRDNK